jgi:hypothetical protein
MGWDGLLAPSWRRTIGNRDGRTAVGKRRESGRVGTNKKLDAIPPSTSTGGRDAVTLGARRYAE